jgi:peptide/nickel transport system substrate-binding protein
MKLKVMTALTVLLFALTAIPAFGQNDGDGGGGGNGGGGESVTDTGGASALESGGGESAATGSAATTTGSGVPLRIGWAQDVRTLNPFVAYDEENYNVWSLTWDLLTNFSPEDLGPVPGIAESWEVSEDKKTVTFQIADRNWSDGEPITSADVKYSLEVLGTEGYLFTGYASSVTKILTPDPKTVVIKTSKPDARIVGGLFIYILPEHIWGEVDIEEVTKDYQPELPMVGSGPYIVTEYTRGRIITMERNPEWTGTQPAFDEVQYIKYGNQDGVERALRLGEIDMIVEVDPSTFGRLEEEEDIEVLSSSSPSYTELGFNICPRELCPDAERNEAITDTAVRQALAYAVDRSRINEIAARGTSTPGAGILPSYYVNFFEEPDPAYEWNQDTARQLLDDAGWVDNGEGEPRTRDGETLEFDLAVRSESAYNIQAARLVAEQAAQVGIIMNVDVMSVDKLTEITTQQIDGKAAPEFDTFIWGWGGDPYDPNFLLSIMTTGEIGNLSDSFYSNPEYDRLYEEQLGEFDVEARKELINQMVNLVQEDMGYLILTDDANLQAYRTDRIADIAPACPTDGGDLICEQVSYEPILALQPAGGAAAASATQDAGAGAVLAAIFGAIALFEGFLLLRRHRSRRPSDEPLEFSD